MLLLELTRLLLQSDSPRVGIRLSTLPIGNLAMALRHVRSCAVVWNGNGAIAGTLVAASPGAAVTESPLGCALHDHRRRHRLPYACIRSYVWHRLAKGQSV